LPTPLKKRPRRRRPMRDGDLPGAGPDPWTLLAIAYAGGDGRGVNLTTVRIVAGIIRQAALTDESLRDELGRLEGAGLVEVRDGKYHPTERFLAFFRTREKRRGVWHDYEDLIRFLARHAPREGGPEARGPRRANPEG
jgi:hypothetical protein